MNTMPLNLPHEDTANPAPLLFDVLRKQIRAKRFSLRTEKAYVLWAERLIRFHPKLHPKEMGAKEVEAFLAHIDSTIGFSLSTQQQALAALAFLYREVLGMDLPGLDTLPRPKKPQRIPVFLTPQEVETIFAHLEEKHHLPARLLYGTGMRLMECVRLRVKDVDFDTQEIFLHDTKGNLDRVVPLPLSLLPALREQAQQASRLWQEDRRQNIPGVFVPPELEREDPNLGEEWDWFWVFPSPSLSTEPRTGHTHRPPRHEQSLQRAIRRAMTKAGISQYASTNTLRHSFAMEYLRSGYDIHSLRKLLGHADVYATKLYTRLLEAGGNPAA